MSRFTKAVKQQLKARIALAGVAGTGKTYSALAIASGLGEKIALIDTERESALLYADLFKFFHCPLPTGNPEEYIIAIEEAGKEGFDVLIIDSFSHAWDGIDGALELVDKATKRSRSKNSFTDGWKEVTPLHRRLIDAILSSPCHVIATMRSKTAYELEERDGKKVPVKLGLAPIQRAGVEFEFTITADMNLDNEMIVSKTRCPKFKRAVIKEPGRQFGEELLAWLNNGEAPPPPPPPTNGHSNGTAERERVRDGIAARRSELGEDRYLELIGDAAWKPTNLAEAKKHLEELEAACRRLRDEEPSWMDEANTDTNANPN